MPHLAGSDQHGGQCRLKSIARSAFPAILIFLIALALRWPSCGESFWLDELHTAWVIDGSWSDVQPRAAIGNQQPPYFDVLWWWQSLTPDAAIQFYGVEACLRLTSVLLTSASAVLAYFITRQITKPEPDDRASRSSWIGAAVAGIVLSIDAHAIFYGTELRPYAAIIFVSTLAIGVVFQSNIRFDANDRWWLHAIVLAAGWIHVTSLITLGWWLALVMMGDIAATIRNEQSIGRLIRQHLPATLIWIVVSAAWISSHSGLWDARSQWQSFALATSLAQVWRLWAWTPLLIVPGLFWWCGDRGHRREVWMLAGAILGATCTGYLVSKYGGVPVWHRRYYVAGLPMIAVLMGCLIDGGGRPQILSAGRRRWAGWVAIVCLGMLAWQQGTVSRIAQGDSRLARRGENWRGAAEFIRSQKPGNEPIWVDANLIEQQRFPARVADSSYEQYLRYPVDGPYRVVGAVGVGTGALPVWLDLSAQSMVNPNRYYLLRGRVPASIELPVEIETHSFGTISVLIRRYGP
ncbi:hypothetical protein [Neorhodopirellula pilleata]|uniref:Glycosyltransferase RgtA/B/C/D-like domain-containing protein n=1 Tax=Neorhodopirellula pilleata TaxID=2714738 RepID=A0A5C6APW7_9BACT|nr:hypothetical protein [Neorhodopirellula pilleata]TWU01578.1 hypothetical protein Pla100_13130 [Neorhodopirellula pilleata]